MAEVHNYSYLHCITVIIFQPFRHVVLVFDEMKIREDIVFDKSTGEVTGFIDYGETNLDQRFVVLKEQCVKQKLDHNKIATHMLTLMVRGIFFKCDYPLAHFSTQGIEYTNNTSCNVDIIRGVIRIPDLHCVASHENVGIDWFRGNQYCC